MKQKRIIINADDVGAHPAVDHAVAVLAEKGVVSSASMMSLGSPDPDALCAMNEHGIDLGLHLDFTSMFASRRYNTTYSVKSLIVAAWRRRLDPMHVRNVINEQLDKFEQLVGARPVFVDGHEHIHQFPIIREALFETLTARYAHQRLFVRSTKPVRWRGTKAAIIGLLGAREARRQAYGVGHQCNTDFGGVYNFAPESDLLRLWSGWLRSIEVNGGLIMCHPAHSVVADDPIALARMREFQFLASDACAEQLDRYLVQVGGWDEALVTI